MPLGTGSYAGGNMGGGVPAVCSDVRRQQQKYTPFTADYFVHSVRENMQMKKREYDAVRATRVFGKLRGAATRYEEKRTFILETVVPALTACLQDATAENKRKLAKIFFEGAQKFSTFSDVSGLAKLFEKFYFSLTDSVMVESANFALTPKKEVDDKSSRTCVAQPVVGVAVSQPQPLRWSGFFAQKTTRRPETTAATPDDLFLFSQQLGLSVPQHALPVEGLVVEKHSDSNVACCV